MSILPQTTKKATPLSENKKKFNKHLDLLDTLKKYYFPKRNNQDITTYEFMDIINKIIKGKDKTDNENDSSKIKDYNADITICSSTVKTDIKDIDKEQLKSLAQDLLKHTNGDKKKYCNLYKNTIKSIQILSLIRRNVYYMKDQKQEKKYRKLLQKNPIKALMLEIKIILDEIEDSYKYRHSTKRESTRRGIDVVCSEAKIEEVQIGQFLGNIINKLKQDRTNPLALNAFIHRIFGETLFRKNKFEFTLEQCCKKINISHPTVIKYLRILRLSGLITRVKIGFRDLNFNSGKSKIDKTCASKYEVTKLGKFYLNYKDNNKRCRPHDEYLKKAFTCENLNIKEKGFLNQLISRTTTSQGYSCSKTIKWMSQDFGISERFCYRAIKKLEKTKILSKYKQEIEGYHIRNSYKFNVMDFQKKKENRDNPQFIFTNKESEEFQKIKEKLLSKTKEKIYLDEIIPFDQNTDPSEYEKKWSLLSSMKEKSKIIVRHLPETLMGKANRFIEAPRKLLNKIWNQSLFKLEQFAKRSLDGSHFKRYFKNAKLKYINKKKSLAEITLPFKSFQETITLNCSHYIEKLKIYLGIKTLIFTS